MTGKELIFKAFAGKPVNRIPWVPFCGIHSGALIGKNATEYLKCPENIVNGLNKAIELYRPDGIPIVFDLQIEAEILNCKLHWNDDNPPAVISHPLAELTAKFEELKIPKITDGRIPIIIQALKTLRAQHPGLALYGLITGPFTLALHLLGTDIFMGMYDDPENIKRILNFCAEVGKKMSQYYIENGCDIIAVVDPMTSQIGPEQFKEFCTEPITAIFDHVRELGAKSSFFVCGHAEKNIEVMCECRCDNISIDENIPLAYVRDICRGKGISFGGNLQLTSVMLLGTPEENKINAVECLDIGGNEGFILAPGCDIPYAVPPENLQAIADVVHNEYQQQIARELAKTHIASTETIDLTSYGNSGKVLIDIITLDSAGCAPCQYMVEAVKTIAPRFGGLVEWKEYKIKEPESIIMMRSLGVKNIPTLCIDGEIKFVSRIPDQEELARTIAARIKAKGL
ncbi:MAG: uroporphyrinogen decarboxylase family protein [Victivallaceae bacterium]